VSHTENGFTFEMTTVPKVIEGETDSITVRIIGPTETGIRFQIRRSKPGQNSETLLEQYATVRLNVSDSATGQYYTPVTGGEKGTKQYYYFEVRDNIGQLLASFTSEDGAPFVLKNFGYVPGPVIALHVLFMFVTVFCVAMGAVYAFGVLRENDDIRSMTYFLLLATVSAFIGGYPFGWAMNHYAFGVVWEGVPFGTDATDNKTQLLFVYLIFATLAGLGSLTRGRFGRDVFSVRTLGGIGVSVFAFMLFIYLIPHSIQFSPELTYGVCYSFIGIVALVYLAALRFSASPKGEALDSDIRMKKRKRAGK